MGIMARHTGYRLDSIFGHTKSCQLLFGCVAIRALDPLGKITLFQPSDEALCGMAAPAVSSETPSALNRCFLDCQLDGAVLAFLPLLVASVPCRLAVTGAAEVRREVLACGPLHMSLAVLRSVTVLALDIGHPGRLRIVYEHRGVVTHGTMRWCPSLLGNSRVEAAIFGVAIIANTMATGTSHAPVATGIVYVLCQDLGVPRACPWSEHIRRYLAIVTYCASLLGLGVPIGVQASYDTHPGTGVDIKGRPTRRFPQRILARSIGGERRITARSIRQDSRRTTGA